MAATVIIGSGVSGVQTALELRQRGYGGEVVLIGEEAEEPYDRPPLSKEYLKGAVDREAIGLLTAQVAQERSISLRLGIRVERIVPAQHEVHLSDGGVVGYEHLVIATGAHNRELPVPGAQLPGVWSLRSRHDADGLRAGLAQARNVVIVGGGFIGLEVAAAAHAYGANVTVVEFLPRVMARVLSPEMSEHFARAHGEHGVAILTEVGVTALIAGDDGRVARVALSTEDEIEADLVVVGVGVVPATELAEEAGLSTANGIVVDEKLRTSDPSIFAVGDCAQFNCVVSGRGLRLESIQNAADQARFVAAHLAAPEAAADGYAALPWFWTEQYESKLQIAGVSTPDSDSVVRGDPQSGAFSVGRFEGDRLIAVESVNRASDHLGARRLLAAPAEKRRRATREAFADAAIPLKTLLDP